MLRPIPKFSHGTQWISWGKKQKIWGVSKNGTPIS
jgi:hypothetical protein